MHSVKFSFCLFTFEELQTSCHSYCKLSSYWVLRCRLFTWNLLFTGLYWSKERTTIKTCSSEGTRSKSLHILICCLVLWYFVGLKCNCYLRSIVLYSAVAFQYARIIQKLGFNAKFKVTYNFVSFGLGQFLAIASSVMSFFQIF